MKSRSKLLLCALAASSLTPLLPAMAQETDADGAQNSEKRYGPVVVTAQRREESLLEVPLSVSAFSGDELLDAGVVTLDEVAKLSPNVTLEASRATNNTLSAFIRGVGQQDPVVGFEAGVGIYIDDVYLNRPQGAMLDIFDVERVEILRGPQGTLYGRNTIGGAVKYVTRPLSDEFELKVHGAYGSYDQADVIVTTSIPVTDTFRVGGSVAMLTHAGYGDNLTLPGVENYNKDVLAGRLSAELDVTSDFQLRVVGDWTKDKSDPKQGHRLNTSYFTATPVLGDVYDTRSGLNVVEQDYEGGGVSVVADWDLNDSFGLKYVFAYREDESTSPIDFDSLAGVDVDAPVIYENDQTSHELQLSYSGERLNGIFGAYLLDANSLNAFDVQLGLTGALISLPGLTAQTFGDVNTDTWSVYGDFTFDLTDRWAVSLGGRYTEDDRTGRVLRTTFIGGFTDFFGGSGIPIAVTSDFDGEASFDDFSPRVSLAYQANDNNNFYGTYSQGFKGGGFDPRGQTTATPDFNQDNQITADEIFEFMLFEPEEVDSYEIGWKTTAFDGRLVSSLAAFYMDYKDVQVPGSAGVDTNNDGVNDDFTGIVTNAGAATIKGVEWEGTTVLGEEIAVAGDIFSFAWSLGYLDGKYDEFIDATGQDVANQRVIQNTPEWTSSGMFNYERPMSIGGHGGTFTANSVLSYRGDSSQFEVPGAIDQSAYMLWDAGVRWQTENERWAVSLTAKNLTDERYIVAGYNFLSPPDDPMGASTLGLEGILTGFYGPPRTVTLGVDFKY
ncbi:MAG: TonB-dependent receptor [Hyphomonas sp.]|nr:TonB-dependent receptor [Hyphomonas sp.]